MRKLKRLRQMTGTEIAYRVRERLRIEAERARVRLARAPQAAPASLEGLPSVDGSFKAYLEQVARSRFYFPAAGETRQSLRSFVQSAFGDWVENAIAEAESICSHRIALLGRGEIGLGSQPNWHTDPITGRVWPVRFWFDYDPVGDASLGDVKNVNELNRHQFLVRLGKAFFLTGEERYAAEALALIDSWLEQNPEGLGINWQSSLELAIRSLSWLWTVFFILEARCFDEQAARRIGHSLFAQLRHVAAYPSTYSSPNTHLIGEAAALFVAGSLFSEAEEARAWRRDGSSLLIEQIEAQVLPEGVHGELSTYYHCYALDFYLQALLLARRLEDPFPHHVWLAAERMTDFLLHVSHPDGSIPLIGDDDGGRALAIEARHYRSFRDALSTGVVLFCRPDFKHQSGGFHEETLWTTGEEGWRIYRAVRGAPPRETSRGFAQAGYYTQRSGWGPSDSHLVFDCGGMGLLSGGHAHADALSLVLFAHGAPLLIDPGTYVYNAAPPWRSFFRSTRAHNTVTVDGRDQGDSSGTFAWSRRAPARLLKRFVHAGIEFLEAEHQGYNLGPGGVIHRRRLLYCPSGYWVIADDFRGGAAPAAAGAQAPPGAEHLFEFYYHLPAGAELGLHEAEGAPVNVLVRNGSGGLLLYFDATVQSSASIRCGDIDPVQGWVSRSYGDHRTAPVLRAAFTAPAPVAALSVAVPFLSAGDSAFPPEPARVDSVAGALACVVELDRFADYTIVSQGAADLEFFESRFAGEFFWIRTRGAEIIQFVAINARHFIHRGSPVFESPTPVPFVSAMFSGDRVVLHCGEPQDQVYVRNLRNLELRPF